MTDTNPYAHRDPHSQHALEARAAQTHVPPLLLPFVWLGRILGWIRRFILNLLTLAFLVLLVMLVIESRRVPALPEAAPLLLALNGELVDQYAYVSPQDYLSPGARGREILLNELITSIEHAADNSRITGLILHLDEFEGGGISKMRELGRALDYFKASGKPIIAIGDYYTQQQYFLASYADEIHMHDMGGVLMTGFGLYRNYFKEALDKLSVQLHVFRAGEFKDFGEPYMRDNMSDESRQHNREWLEAMWQTYTAQVEDRRNLPRGSVDEMIHRFAEHMRTHEGDAARVALQFGLVDFIGPREERNQRLIARFGHPSDNSDEVLFIHLHDYQAHLMHDTRQAPAEHQIALIVARGTILDGRHPEGTIGGDSLRDLIRTARDDPRTKAVVLRVDSGGGSAFASEIIRQELQVTRERGLPVIISMGSVAASGGYWIATAADEVWATPSTITGSIGVFGLLPTLDQSLARLGIHTDGLGTTPLAGALRPDLPLAPEVAELVQQSIEQMYHRFLTVVAEGRNTDPEEIDPIARGRVWTGVKALELGLVDKLGDLSDAVESAAALAGLDTYELVLIERERTAFEQFMQQMMEIEEVRTAAASLLSARAPVDSQLLQHLSGWLQHISLFEPGAKRPIYALCLDCTAL